MFNAGYKIVRSEQELIEAADWRDRSAAVGYLYGIICGALISLGGLKATPLLGWVPVDPLLVLLTGASLLLVAGYSRPTRWRPEVLSVFLLAWALLSSGIVFATTPRKLLFVFLFVPFLIYMGIRLAHMRLGVLGFLDGSIVMGGLSCLALGAFPNETAGGAGLSALGGNPIDSTRALTFALLCLAIRAWIVRPKFAALLVQGSLAAILLWYGVQTGSRGPWLAFLVAIFLSAALSRHRIRILSAGLITTMGLVTVWQLGARDAIRQLPLFNRVFDVSQTDDITTGRGDIASVAIRGIWSNPLGIGWGSFGEYSRSYGLSSVEYAHNIVLEVAVESGILGLVGFIMFVLAVYSFAWRSRGLDSGKVAGVALTFWLVAALFSSDFSGNRGVWLCAGLAIGSYIISRSTTSDNCWTKLKLREY